MAADEGRACPVHYRYRPERLCEQAETVADDVLYMIGGLYGNPFALNEIESMARRERASGRSVRLVFNGDFNWFNASDSLFREINQRVLRHTASLGNVEYELAHPSAGAGCGCAYPDFVDQGWSSAPTPSCCNCRPWPQIIRIFSNPLRICRAGAV